MRTVLVPEGKTLALLVGNYIFHGPYEIKMEKGFVFPTTYTDGSPLIFDEPKKGKRRGRSKKSNQPDADSTQVQCCEGDGQCCEVTGEHCNQPNGDFVVREGSGEMDGT